MGTKISADREVMKKKAIELAKKKKGKLTYDDLNDLLPADSGADISVEIDEMMVMLSGMDIDIVDELRVDAESKQVQEEKEKDARRAEARKEAAQTRLERA
ncbi:MAG TPA: RNA polymerase sigma factor region1.1 domain-containing protein, partial [Candidatus Hydrogenedentes bacterium]|nr:RNA polymerase sigma factor region1.1 domain-containing protein [Candidatus Hydrogenedentota bacterium]